ncbi:MAG: hypothetical protein J7K29_06140 [Candidatus Cloacimonetes bacterium]|nr:hypothetical protein [Candidatus Cloacimonadota bacterium]
MISHKLLDAFNEQINKELYSEYLYFSMDVIVSKLKMIGGNRQGLLMINNDLSTRVFNPPVK